MATISTLTEIKTHIDADGNAHTETLERTTKVERSTEPDFIKIYTKMWCEFNRIPDRVRPLFLELVTRMTYCNAADIANSQLVNTGRPWSSAIMKTLGIQSSTYKQYLRELCECNAIRKVNRGVYQINPAYAGRGEWKYNPKLQRGGVEDLVANFKFKDQKVETKIVWADDGTDDEMNEMFRTGLGVQKKDSAILKTQRRENGHNQTLSNASGT